ncbi:MAG: SMP-30/gluconolactonase/LRE family protein [Actinobacteria bacterium]|nr:SMP-30/gluconolactonase/LRE family protein [Actinomycetota bacterium]
MHWPQKQNIIAILFVILFSCTGSQKQNLSSVLAPNAKLVKLSKGTDFQFTEGPVWSNAGYLLFSDIPNSHIIEYLPDGTFSIFRKNTNGANGLMFDISGRLVACEGNAGRVTAMDSSGEIHVLASEYKGKRFNSPNDLVIDSTGGIYFTDPLFGRGGKLSQNKEAVYYLHADGRIRRIIDNLAKPNGIILAPDGKKLFIVDTYNKFVWAYLIDRVGFPMDAYIFAELKLPNDAQNNRSGADGITIDVAGNLYITSSLGVQVFNSNGDLLGIIGVPEKPANCTIGGPDNKTLYITARKNLYAIQLQVEGVVFPL